jgi:peptidoglycan hydrolase-like protein with peptidoglycan-binding domain
MNNYLRYNPIAKRIFEEEASRISDSNLSIENLIKSVCNNSFDIFKIVCFDLGSSVERNPDNLREKLKDIADSKSVREVTSKLKDYCSESEISSRLLSDTKNIYCEALDQFCDALNRIDEISNKKGMFAVSCVKSNCSNLQKNVDFHASEKQRRLDKMEGFVNESIFVGFGDRIENLRKILYNLITSAEGKNQKSGHGKDWKRIFIELDQKLNVLQATKAGISEKDRKSLDDLEHQIDKYSDEFYNSYSLSCNRHMSEIGDSDDLMKYYSDVLEICSRALDTLARAKAQYMETLRMVRDQINDDESEMIKYIFPLKPGDDDSNKRFNGTGIILAIQNALGKGVPSIGEIFKTGAEKGIYGPKTESVVKAIQKNIGNKNVDGKIDKSLLDSILVSDFIDKSDRDKILETLRSLKKPINESISELVYSDIILENKIVIDKELFTKDLSKYINSIKTDESSNKLNKNEKDLYNIEDLCKNLRKNYGLKVESDDFKREDGNYRSSYSAQFIEAWGKAVEEIGSEESYHYFFWDNGLYSLDSEKTSLKNARNWHSWASSRQLRELSSDDAREFLASYVQDWTSFGNVKMEFRISAFKNLYKKNSELDLKLPGVYNMAENLVSDSEIPYLPYEFLTKKLGKAIEEISQVGESDPDLDAADIVLINNILCMVANTVSFDGEKFISPLYWIYDNCLVPSTATRIAGDSVVSKQGDKNDFGYVLMFYKNTIKVKSPESLEEAMEIDLQKDIAEDLNGWGNLSKLAKSSSSNIKKVFGANIHYIASRVYPSIKNHVKRMNSKVFSDVPQEKDSRCYNCPSK